MGLIEALTALVFGSGRNVIKETAGIFMENSEAAAEREALWRAAALSQFGAEFTTPRKGWFDRLMDGLNRLPRPALALGTLGLFGAAMADPIWFSARMQGLALVPEPLWWLMGAIVSFYFGARQQLKGQEFQRSIAETMLRTSAVLQNLAALQTLAAGDEAAGDENPALTAWRGGDAS